MKKILGKLIVLFLLCCVFPALAWAFPVSGEITEPITGGAVLVSQKVTTGAGAVKVYMVKVDLKNEYINIDTIVGSDGTFQKNQSVTSMARSAGAVAAINGDFFQMAESGRPIGLTFKNGSLIGSPAMRTDMYGFGYTIDRLPLIDIFGFQGSVLAQNGTNHQLFGINKPGYLLLGGASSDQNKLLMYTPDWGEKTRDNIKDIESVTEAIVQNGVVSAVRTGKGGTAIPRGGYVLSGNGTAAEFITKNLPVGSTVEVDSRVLRREELVWPGSLVSAIGGQALLVDNGVIPQKFTQDITGRHARTAVGISQQGDVLYLVAVEKSSESPGMDQRELAEYLVSQGVWRAVNIDGGGSTTLAARHLGDREASLVNLPQAGSQRSVPNAIGVYSTAPAGMFQGLILQGPTVVISGAGADYSVKAYDEYYNPYELSNREVSFSVPAEYGKFEGNTLQPVKSGKVNLLAQYNNAQSELAVEILGRDKMASLEAEPSSVQAKPGESTTIKIKVKTVDGRVFELTGDKVNWAVEQSVGTVKDGIFTTSQNIEAGRITASFEGLSVDIPVEVRTANAVAIELEPEWPMEAWIDSGLRAYFPSGITDRPIAVKLSRKEPTNVSLPENLTPLEVLNVELADTSLELNKSWQLHWEFPAIDEGNRVTLFKWDNASNVWVEQPVYTANKLLTARLWATGSFVAALDLRPTPNFTDVANHWAEAVVKKMATTGIVTGFPEGDFRPEEGVTRAQFVAMLGRALGWDTLQVSSVTLNFTDEIPAWAAEHISAAMGFGVVEGYPDGTFLPNKKINRSEMAVIIYRALGLHLPEGSQNNDSSYSDGHSIPEWAREAIGSASAAGLLQGSGGLFRPSHGATRAEAATVIGRAQQNWICSGVTYTI